MVDNYYKINTMLEQKLLEEINKQALKNNRIIDCLLQIYIAEEESKFGLDEVELQSLLNSYTFNQMNNIRIVGLS